MREKAKTFAIIAAPSLAVIGAGILVTRSCSTYTIDAPNYTSTSEPIGIVGSVEYTRFKDGSEEILVTEHSLQTHTTLYQNLDGDNKIDRIRFDVRGAGGNSHLEKLLVRSVDFESNKDLFNQADRLLPKLRKKN